MRFPSRTPFCLLIVLLALGIAYTRDAKAAGPEYLVDLYTIGPSNVFESRFGHSLLCVRKTTDKEEGDAGTCYDYGVADRPDLLHIAWTMTRGTPSFLPITVGEGLMVQLFKDQGRRIEKQRLPLSFDEAARLVAAMDEDVVGRRVYAYHPYSANCATRLRDLIDTASNGRLRKGPTTILPKGTYREQMEEGHSGHIDILAPMALYLGEGSDHTPTPWEAMYLPSILRDGVSERFAAAPTIVAERVEPVIATSRVVGRVSVVFLAFLVSMAVRLAARRGRVRLALAIAGWSLFAIALSVELVSALVKWPEISHNWALLLFLPTDLGIAFFSASRIRTYVRIRLGMAGLLFLLEIGGVIHQPILPLAIVLALPLSAVLAALRTRATTAPEEPAGQRSTAVES